MPRFFCFWCKIAPFMYVMRLHWGTHDAARFWLLLMMEMKFKFQLNVVSVVSADVSEENHVQLCGASDAWGLLRYVIACAPLLPTKSL